MAVAVAAVLVLYMREEAVRGVFYEESEGEEEQVVLYAKELQWWETHTMMGPEGVLVPREVVPEVESNVVEAEGPVPISHPTSHSIELLPDPALEEEEESEERSDPEVEIRRWLESGGGKGVKRRWEDPTRKE